VIEQFGISVARLAHNFLPDLNDLNVDLIQVPLHLGLPDEYIIDMVADKDTQIIGKLVPDPVRHDRKFFHALCQRYKNRIKIWDFGGEPETRPDQPGCRWPGTAREFAASFRDFWEEAKSANPDCQVGVGGFLAPTFNGLYGNESRFGFLEELFCEGVGYSADYFSLNLYLRGYGGNKNYVAGVLKFKELMARYRQHGKPIVISETGVPSGGDPQYLHIIQTEDRQAVSLVENYMISCSLEVDYTIWYTLRNEAWGIIDGRGRRRPAYNAFQNMIRVLKGTEYCKTVKALPSASVEERWLTDHTHWHVFGCRDGREVHVVWMSGGNRLVRKLPPQATGGCDMYGSDITNKPNFVLDASPKYISAPVGALHSYNFLLE
jgi:hypothetical protein